MRAFRFVIGFENDGPTGGRYLMFRVGGFRAMVIHAALDSCSEKT
jgi:hypothetical protein